MAEFLDTTAINYRLEQLIKNAKERLILISPFMKLNDRIKELLEDKNRLKIDVRVIYGKNELQPEEINWLKELEYIRTSFCKNLHAKCYLNEDSCIITSLNLYEFSQINNNEMGVFISKEEDLKLYEDTYSEARRIVRISDEVRITLERIEKEEDEDAQRSANNSKNTFSKLTSSKLAQKHKLKTPELLSKLIALGYIAEEEGKQKLTKSAHELGAEFKYGKHGPYFLWPEDLQID